MEKSVKYSNPSQEFIIEFPQSPLLKTEKETNQFGHISWNIAYLNKNNNNEFYFLIKYADLPADFITSNSLPLLDSFFLNTQQDLTEKKIPFNLRITNNKKYPGREFHFLDSNNNISYTRDVFLVNNRLYFLEVKCNINNDYRNEIDAFLKSFSLTAVTENSNPEIIEKQQTKKFTIKFPAKTTTTTQTSFNPFFGNLTITKESCETDFGLYCINFSELPKDKLQKITSAELQKFITEAFTSNVLNTNGKIISKKQIEIDGHSAFEGIGSIQDGEALIHLKSVIIDNYYYQYFVIYAMDGENNPATKDFLNSFRIN
ncbi:hypothetical protein [Pinibacter soli]|uniref:Uncharacterized protein n=1 Tax=Pinibacter soli TaxID=3044211 RepID=A0ABT6RBI1_9BACT|nr:hypothetical protein [Pinibacter soli]MDI3319289.1 hypothetical protein [Pinibacter soli]